MTGRQRALAQPQGRSRMKPGTRGMGRFYRIVVRPKSEFVTFRNHDVGRKGHVQRLAGKRSSGSWDTQAWLINKGDAHVEDGSLVADTTNARKVIDRLGSEPRKVKADIFEARPRPDVPEREKPTAAQRRSRMENIRKAQEARWRS